MRIVRDTTTGYSLYHMKANAQAGLSSNNQMTILYIESRSFLYIESRSFP